MLLAIDIGNSQVKFGVFDRENLISSFRIPTDRTQSENEIYALVKENLNHSISAVVISSVVPELNASFQKFGEKYFKTAPVIVDDNLDFGLKIRYRQPEKLGIDRAVAAFAAREKYGKPAIVCDFGTATTIDVVNQSGEFIGGIITPGIRLLADSLFQKTSKLPRIEIEKPEKVIGDSTVSAIRSGIYFGYTSLVEGILQKMFAELCEKPKVVATGGYARLIADGVQKIEIVDETLLLDGLRLIYERINEK